MDYYKEKRSPNYDLQDFLQLRKHPQAYLVFFKHFIKCITRKSVFENNIRTAKTYNDICSISDEAFALLLLENSWHRWMDIHSQDNSALLPRRGTRTLQNVTCMIPTKYTKGGYKYYPEGPHESAPTSYSKRKGWSAEGIQRYNELFDQIEADRQAHPEFLNTLLVEVRNQNLTTSYKSQNQPNKRPPITARHHLFESSPTHENNPDLITSGSQHLSQTSKFLTQRNPFVEEHMDSEEEYENGQNEIGQQREQV